MTWTCGSWDLHTHTLSPPVTAAPQPQRHSEAAAHALSDALRARLKRSEAAAAAGLAVADRRSFESFENFGYGIPITRRLQRPLSHLPPKEFTKKQFSN
jgi:hypothetical protein